MISKPAVSFEELFEQNHRSLLAYCRRRINPELAWTVTVGTFADARRRLLDAPDDVLPWLFGLAFRRLTSEGRKKARRDWLTTLLPGREAESNVQSQVEMDLKAQAFVLVLGMLDGRDQELVKLRAWEGLDVIRAGAVLGLTADKAESRLRMAEKRMAGFLGSLSIEDKPEDLLLYASTVNPVPDEWALDASGLRAAVFPSSDGGGSTA